MSIHKTYRFAWAALLLFGPRMALASLEDQQQLLSAVDPDPDFLSFLWPSDVEPADVLPRDTLTNDPDEPFCADKRSSRYDPLACWLWKVKIAVPDQSFKKSLVTVV